MIPQKPHAPCTATASTTSSTRNFFIRVDTAVYTKPPIKPMIIDSKDFTTAQGAGIETKPARIPLQKPQTSKARGSTTLAFRANTINPAAHGASVVLTATRPAWIEAIPTKPQAERAEHSKWNVVRCKLVLIH